MSETFRHRIAGCLAEAQQRGEIPAACDVRQTAELVVTCWEDAALRGRLRRDPAPLAATPEACLDAVARQLPPPFWPRNRRRRLNAG